MESSLYFIKFFWIDIIHVYIEQYNALIFPRYCISSFWTYCFFRSAKILFYVAVQVILHTKNTNQ